MSSKGRYDVRRAFRNVERAADFRLTEPSRADLDEHLDALLSVWDARWGKGNEQATATYRHVFRRSFDDSTLWLRVVWDASEPMAVLAAFVDQGKRILYQHIMAFNRKFNKRSPGRALVGYSIRDAIDRGIATYDFLLGDEEYKYSFGAKKRSARSAVVIRRSLRGTIGDLLLRLRALLTRQRKRLRRVLSSVRN